MRFEILKSVLVKSGLAASILMLASGVTYAQQVVNLSAGRTHTTLPDGSYVPMWSYSCGSAVVGSTATCANLNPNAPAAIPATTTTPAVPAGWSPVVITVPSGQDLQIKLTNTLPVPTSLTIVGQLGGGLGNSATSDASPTHSTLVTTWPVANTPGAAFNPPPQGNRVRSFATEVASGGGVQALTWTAPRPGTYLLESGTHPSIQGPMGLYGIVVVTAAPTAATTGTAYPAAGPRAAISYSAEIPLLLSEIDPVQNTAVDTAVMTTGFSEGTVWKGGPTGCGAAHTCYPPTVNYTPLYYLINGVAFNKTAASAS
ncbi:MAG: hypothetical protein KGL25_13545, partial [Gammaproteobacteria bacterium]|nr:hypothetical protein [Gammaproteobacteria bacterium]